MRIISSYKDYYDYASCFGIDPKHFYIRKTEEFTDDIPKPVSDDQILGFCGKLYRIITPLEILPYAPSPSPLAIELCKRYLRIVPFSEERVYTYRDKGRSFYTLRNNLENEYLSLSRANAPLSNCNAFLTKINKSIIFKEKRYWRNFISSPDKYLSYFNKYDTPVFYVSKSCVIVNPVLHKIKFHTEFTAPLAFQEIDMFISNQNIRPDSDVPVGGDDIIILSKGFDRRSFRKDREERKH